MELQVDLRVFELLSSRLCHDLVSPVGAVKSGLELFTEFGDDPDGDTMALIGGSADQASRKLQFFRAAYGQAGTQREGVKLSEVVDLLTAVAGNQRTKIEAPDGVVSGAGNGKLLMNMGLIVADAIPRGGVVTISASPEGLRAEARGAGAALDVAMTEAMTLNVAVDALDAKTVQGYFTALLAKRVGTQVQVEVASPDSVALTVAVTNATTV